MMSQEAKSIVRYIGKNKTCPVKRKRHWQITSSITKKKIKHQLSLLTWITVEKKVAFIEKVL